MNRGDIIGGKYRLLRRLGQGAMGVVWEAINESTMRAVALKLILRPNDELRLRLLREARACGKLAHRNVIEVLDVNETEEGEPFLVMPLLHGETLAALLARTRRLEIEDATRIARDIAYALAAAHQAGVIHRDLKPENVFLHHEAGSSEPVVKVLDFGVSKSRDVSDGMSTMTGGVVGSPAYMSPEQAAGRRDIDHRSDIWSLGVVLFEMLTAARPFKGDLSRIMIEICTSDPPPLSRYLREVDPTLEELVARCLQRDPAHRPASADALANELERFALAVPKAKIESSSNESISLADETTLPLDPKDGVPARPQSPSASSLSTTTPLVQSATCSPSAPELPPPRDPRPKRNPLFPATAIGMFVVLLSGGIYLGFSRSTEETIVARAPAAPPPLVGESTAPEAVVAPPPHLAPPHLAPPPVSPPDPPVVKEEPPKSEPPPKPPPPKSQTKAKAKAPPAKDPPKSRVPEWLLNANKKHSPAHI